MAVNEPQYIRDYIQYEEIYNIGSEQVSQITLNGRFEVEILKVGNRILIDNGEAFFFSSPDLPNMTIHQVLSGLGYTNHMMRVVWCDNNDRDNVLNSPAVAAPVSQIRMRTNHVNQMREQRVNQD
jgi:hypothetical protein